MGIQGLTSFLEEGDSAAGKVVQFKNKQTQRFRENPGSKPGLSISGGLEGKFCFTEKLSPAGCTGAEWDKFRRSCFLTDPSSR